VLTVLFECDKNEPYVEYTLEQKNVCSLLWSLSHTVYKILRTGSRLPCENTIRNHLNSKYLEILEDGQIISENPNSIGANFVQIERI
jgi:hypothetical protein